MRSFVLSVFLVMGLAASTSAQVVGTITGRVTDGETGEPLPSVQLSIPGSQQGSLSSPDGRYQIANVPSGVRTLRAERIGYGTVNATITVPTGGTIVQDFLMSLQALAMDEIVVTGVPGGTRVRAIGNSVGRLDAAAVAAVAPVTDVQSLLRGRAPGVNLMGTGTVGTSPRMRIRGASSLSLSSQPLIYIDGIRANNQEEMGLSWYTARGVLGSLEPEQIERIEVLKGPAAATLYGTEASRGVVNIITKRGQEGGVQVEMMVRQGVNFVGNPQGKVGYDNYWTDPADGQIYSVNMLDYMDELGREIYSYGQVQNYSASLSGGSQDSQYFFSGAYQRDVGSLSHNWVRKFNMRTNFDTQVSDNVSVALNMGYTNNRDRGVMDGYSSITEGIEFGNPRNQPEHLCRVAPGVGCDTQIGFPAQALPARERSQFDHVELNRFTGGLTFNFEAFGWLTGRATSGLDFTGELNSWSREFQTNDSIVKALGTNGAKGFRNEARRNYILTTTDVSSTAEWGLTSSLSSSTSVGVQYYTRNVSFLSATGTQFAGPGLSTITALGITGTPQNNNVSNNTVGSYVQETLAWKDRLFLTGAVRVDNNSAFGDQIDWITYPKFSLSWVMNEEPWFDVMPSFLNTLRLRGAWGQSGEQPAAFSALRTWSPVTGVAGPGVTPSTLGNPELTAEVGEETEVGLDMDLFDNRLGVEFSYYHKLTKDAILERSLPPSAGFTGRQFFNAGRIRNDGFELGLNANLVDGSAWGLDVGFNLSYNDAEILQLSGEPGDTSIIFNSWSSLEHRVGAAPFSWFGRDVVSGDWDASGNAINVMCSDGSGGTTPCFDASGNTIGPRVDLGRAIPPWELSFYTDIAIGADLRFHALFTSMQGHKRFDNTERQRCRLYNVCRENSFPEEWIGGDIEMKATIQSSDQIIDAWVNDVSFIRLKEVSLSYDLPDRLSLGVNSAVLQVAATNVAVWSDWTAGDPETMYTTGGRYFMAQNNIPLPTQIVASIRVNF